MRCRARLRQLGRSSGSSEKRVPKRARCSIISYPITYARCTSTARCPIRNTGGGLAALVGRRPSGVQGSGLTKTLIGKGDPLGPLRRVGSGGEADLVPILCRRSTRVGAHRHLGLMGTAPIAQ